MPEGCTQVNQWDVATTMDVGDTAGPRIALPCSHSSSFFFGAFFVASECIDGDI